MNSGDYVKLGFAAAIGAIGSYYLLVRYGVIKRRI